MKKNTNTIIAIAIVVFIHILTIVYPSLGIAQEILDNIALIYLMIFWLRHRNCHK